MFTGKSFKTLSIFRILRLCFQQTIGKPYDLSDLTKYGMKFKTININVVVNNKLSIILVLIIRESMRESATVSKKTK